MKRHFHALAISALAVWLFVACASQLQGAKSGLSDISASTGSLSGLREKCGGQNGVRVRPCPVKLTSPSQKVIVAISGPGVVSGSYLGSCYDICSITRLEHHSKEWQVVPGASCGEAGLLFQGINRRHILVGNADLTIINKSC